MHIRSTKEAAIKRNPEKLLICFESFQNNLLGSFMLDCYFVQRLSSATARTGTYYKVSHKGLQDWQLFLFLSFPIFFSLVFILSFESTLNKTAGSLGIMMLRQYITLCGKCIVSLNQKEQPIVVTESYCSEYLKTIQEIDRSGVLLKINSVLDVFLGVLLQWCKHVQNGKKRSFFDQCSFM